MANKPSIVSMARGGMYIATVALPAAQQYKVFTDAGKTGAEAANDVVRQMVGIHPTTGEFSWDLIKFHWTPVVAWTAIDTIASKMGVYKRVGRLIGNFNLMG